MPPELPITWRPKRRWMSIADLVTKVEVALLTGERHTKGDSTYANLDMEADRLRIANDGITAQVCALKQLRAEYVAREEQVSARMAVERDCAQLEPELVTVLEELETVDQKLAGLRYEHQQNIKDVGHLKRTMSIIEKGGQAGTLLDRVHEALVRGSGPLCADGPEARALTALVDRLRAESDDVFNTVMAHTKEFEQLMEDLRTTQLDLRGVRDLPGTEADEIRSKVVAQLKESKRKLAQLSRLRDIQVINADEIAMLERVRAKIIRHSKISKLLAEGDKASIEAEVKNVEKEIASLRRAINEMEAGADDQDNEAAEIIECLRHPVHRDTWTRENSELREKLIAIIHGEQNRLGRLAVLRNEKAQHLRFLVALKAALRK